MFQCAGSVLRSLLVRTQHASQRGRLRLGGMRVGNADLVLANGLLQLGVGQVPQ